MVWCSLLTVVHDERRCSPWSSYVTPQRGELAGASTVQPKVDSDTYIVHSWRVIDQCGSERACSQMDTPLSISQLLLMVQEIQCHV